MTLKRRFLRSFQENVELGTVLAFVAGVVNTVGFLQFGAFVSHMSGHATRSAVEYAEGNSAAALVFFLELITFITGALTTAFLMHGHTAAVKQVKLTGPVVLEAFCLALFLGLNHAHGISLTTLILAYAMGLQNAMHRHASGTIIRTTHVTGIATDIGIELGSALHQAHATLAKTRTLRSAIHAFWQRLSSGRLTFHCFLITAFFLGAVVGTIGYLFASARILLLPLVLLSWIAVKEYRRPLPVSH